MPVWNDETKSYEEENIVLAECEDPLLKAQREERFRTALLNELDQLQKVVYSAGADIEARIITLRERR